MRSKLSEPAQTATTRSWRASCSSTGWPVSGARPRPPGGLRGRGAHRVPSPAPSVRAALSACLLLAAASLALPSEPSYDPWAWLVWGRELGNGTLDTAGGPSWKPGSVAVTVPLAPLGAELAPALWLLLVRAAGLLSLVLAARSRRGSPAPRAPHPPPVTRRRARWPPHCLRCRPAGGATSHTATRRRWRWRSTGATELHLNGRPRAAFALIALVLLLRQRRRRSRRRTAPGCGRASRQRGRS